MKTFYRRKADPESLIDPGVLTKRVWGIKQNIDFLSQKL
jgi:hypothetical protein